MEILLLTDVGGIGKKNDLLVVGDGYALNCLLPQRKALVATPTVRKRYADQIRKRAEEKEREKATQQQVVSALAGKMVTLTKKASKTGKLYAAVNEEAISEALKDQLNINIPADSIVLQEPIKAVGKFGIQIKAGANLQSLSVTIVGEK
jgi:large subunit ribosomal protein L9